MPEPAASTASSAIQPSLFAFDPQSLMVLGGSLVLAAILGWAVALVYRYSRKSVDVISSFPPTLVLLCILIAMVTQVIGDNLARAFGLVGALSIVRFRTVVRDTQDTAYVIFAVVVGMAVGAHHPWVALIGLIVIGVTAQLMKRREGDAADAQPAFLLNIRLAIGQNMEPMHKVIDEFVQGRDLLSIATAKSGVALDLSYETRLRPHASANELVRALNKVEGVQGVEIQRRNIDQN
ncbi:MAG TPA: DUF4956 domain-containing protein [Verrucomicrobiae bacterium]